MTRLTAKEVAAAIDAALRSLRFEFEGDGELGLAMLFAGWRIEFFVDAGDIDYVDNASAPDGRAGEFGSEHEWGGYDSAGAYVPDPLDLTAVRASEIALISSAMRRVWY